MKTSLTTDPDRSVIVGKSTKQDVLADLGSTRVIQFDSGYEVWVYQLKDDRATSLSFGAVAQFALLGKGSLGEAEYIVLFDPSGVVAKTRVRHAAAKASS